MDNGASKKAVLVTMLMTSFITASNMSMINVALPAIGRELFMDAVLLGWVVAAHLLTTASFQLPLEQQGHILNINYSGN